MEVRVDEDNTHKLYEASVRGSVETFNTLIQTDRLILHKVSLTLFRETPLHISALLGHVEFTKALLDKKPELVTRLDSFKRSPLHLASAEGHKEIVKDLLNAGEDVCLVADQDGRIPLHLAAMRGRVEVIQELISAKPESIRVQLHGDTVLHLCVRYNQLDALKLLLALVTDEEFLNSKDHEGNTILLASAKLKQFETIRYLLSDRAQRIRLDVNSLVAALEDQHLSDVRNDRTQNYLQLQASLSRGTHNIQRSESNITRSRKFFQSLQLKFSHLLEYQGDQYENTRGNLIVVATLIAQMSFQVATSPPGGFWEKDTNKAEQQGCPEGTCKAGTSILSYTSRKDYKLFITCSTLSLVASLSIILLLISRVPLRNKISVGILVIGMWTAVILIATTYIFSIRLIQVHDNKIFPDISSYYPMFLAAVIFFLFVFHIVRFSVGVILDKQFLAKSIGILYSPVKKLINCIRRGRQRQSQQQPGDNV